jgi:antitoxin component of RelBE/YafQ-DinJ toxin-antitoxin module
LESRGLPDNVLEQLKLRPTDTLKAIGVDPDSLIRIAIAEKMRADGKEVPAELRAAIDKADSQRELQELRARLEAKDRAEQARAYYDQVNMGAREWLGQETNLKDTQSVASAFKKDADFVHREIMSIIASDASRKGPNEKHLSYAEAAKIADKHWTKLKSILSDDNSAQPQGSKQAIPTKANVSGGPPTRPPEKPMAPWLQRHALAEEGVKAALQEFQRVEGLNGIRK